jgi:hypothetical protein
MSASSESEYKLLDKLEAHGKTGPEKVIGDKFALKAISHF